MLHFVIGTFRQQHHSSLKFNLGSRESHLPSGSGRPLCLVVANTSATDHMLPNWTASISYKAMHNLRVHMGNSSYAPVIPINYLNGPRLLMIRNILHVPALRVPLYSLLAHLRQTSCVFKVRHDTGMHVYFPGVVLSVDMSTNCRLSCKPLGKLAPLSTLHYVQPCCTPTHYPAKQSAFCACSMSVTTPSMLLQGAPAVIKDVFLLPVCRFFLCHLWFWHHLLCRPCLMPQRTFLLSHLPSQSKPGPWAPKPSIAQHLQLLFDQLSGLPTPPSSPPADSEPPTPQLLSSLSPNDVIGLVHRPMAWTRRPIGLPKYCTGLWDVAISGSTSTSIKPALMVSGWLVASCPCQLVPTPPFRKRCKAA